jgi:hypothetical protein
MACPSCRTLDHPATRRMSSLLLPSSVSLNLPSVISSPNQHQDVSAIPLHLSKSFSNFNPDSDRLLSLTSLERFSRVPFSPSRQVRPFPPFLFALPSSYALADSHPSHLLPRPTPILSPSLLFAHLHLAPHSPFPFPLQPSSPPSSPFPPLNFP